MTHRRGGTRFAALFAVAVLAVAALAVAACGPSTTDPTLGPTATASSAAVSSAPTVQPSAAPTTRPTTAPSATPTAVPTACPITPETGPLPSDRLVDVTVSTSADGDRLTFVFGNMSVPGPAGPPTGEFKVATPPFTFGPSGLPIDMVGEHVLQVVFRQMSLQADTGDPVYQGQPELSPDDVAVKHAVMFDESEGVVGWYVGYDGPGCVTLTRDGNAVTLSFAHAS